MTKLKETAPIYSVEAGAITVVSRQGCTEIPLALRRKYQKCLCRRNAAPIRFLNIREDILLTAGKVKATRRVSYADALPLPSPSWKMASSSLPITMR